MVWDFEMCDVSEEEFAEYLRWIEAAMAPPVPARVRPAPMRKAEEESFVAPAPAAVAP